MIDPRRPDYADTPVADARPTYEYRPRDPRAAPAVSIITPYFNPEPLFEETARSVLGQSLQQWEWLIVNDGSTDASARARLDAWRERDPRIRVLDHPENRGLPAARNTGIRAARSEYVLLLDDDDLLEPTAAETLFWLLESHPEFTFAGCWSVGFGAQEYLWARGFDEGAAFLEENLVPCIALIRKQHCEQVGGFDETLRDGFEDWDFWLRSAAAGAWGRTVPQYLTWYRRRADHGDRWENLGSDEARAAFRERLRTAYPRLFQGAFPRVEPRPPVPFAAVRQDLPCANGLAKSKPRLLMLVPWLTMGGSDKFNLDVVEQLSGRGWEVTLATTLAGDNVWLPEFARFTSDIFILPDFLKLADQPAFLRYLIQSRQPDVVLLTHSEAGYLWLPYLRCCCPEPLYLDYNHIEDESWNNGGYPRHGAGLQPWLDRNLVSSRHLKEWMAARGAVPERIDVVYTSIDPARWKPDPPTRQRVRAEFQLADNLPVLLYAVRLDPQKQPMVFARVMAALAQRDVAFCALVAGDGPDRPRLEAYLQEHALGQRVRLLGQCSIDRIRELMAAGDVLFLPSRWEGIALSVYEAMASGTVVVGAAVGGQEELVTPECGILLPRGEPDAEVRAYTEALAALLADPDRRATLARRGRERILARFTLDAMGTALLAAFERARDARSTCEFPRLSSPAAHELASQATEHLRVAALAHWLYAGAPSDRPVADAESSAAQLTEQRDHWAKVAKEAEDQLEELRGWVAELEKGKAWLEEQREILLRDRQNLTAGRAQTQQAVEQWKRQFMFRVLRRAGLLRDLTLE